MGKRFSVIYADPPWRYRSTGLSGCAENHYHTMRVEDIQALLVEAINLDDCVAEPANAYQACNLYRR